MIPKIHPQPPAKVPPWTPLELHLHKEAVARLEKILADAVGLVGHKKLTEEQLYKIMVERMQKVGLTSLLNWAIVAYGTSAADPHYHFKPKHSRLIKPGALLMLDIWGKLNRPDAPYADITHTYFVGKNPSTHFQKLWHDLKTARDRALREISQKRTVPGAHLHLLAEKHLDGCGYKGLFIHGLGHDLGHDHVHGPGANLSPRYPHKLIAGRGYTIEPGIYKPGKFGLRSEIDFFLASRGRVNVTTRLQNELECI
ncbi:aminopeptidase P family protein [Candidatus Uhrbacteria bacterium]|nr:aminopeptidase P family protein [Candidatus Uhrbacteria bacterium]